MTADKMKWKLVSGQPPPGGTEVRSAQQATEIAVNFLKKYRLLSLPVSALRQNDLWEVKVDVGTFATLIATVHIQAKTGEITDYAIPTERKGG